MNIIDNRTAANRAQYQGYNNSHKYISIHYLGVDGQNANLYNNGYGGHYTIFWNGDIYWSADHYAVLWQVGTAGCYTKKYPNGWDVTNYNSIGIEMCCHYENGHWYFTRETQEACIELVKFLMGTLNITADKVLRHYDIVNKDCPMPYVLNDKYKTSWTWDEFKAKLIAKEEDELVVEAYNDYRVEKHFNPPVIRYVGVDKLEVKVAPSDASPRHPYWGYLSRGNGVEVMCTFDSGYAEVYMSQGKKGTGTTGFVDARKLYKK